jgi:hypothetical protein
LRMKPQWRAFSPREIPSASAPAPVARLRWLWWRVFVGSGGVTFGSSAHLLWLRRRGRLGIRVCDGEWGSRRERANRYKAYRVGPPILPLANTTLDHQFARDNTCPYDMWAPHLTPGEIRPRFARDKMTLGPAGQFIPGKFRVRFARDKITLFFFLFYFLRFFVFSFCLFVFLCFFFCFVTKKYLINIWA